MRCPCRNKRLPTLADALEKHPADDAPAYGYGVLRYVLSDSVTLDRVLFNVPSMLSVRTDNRHNQFCVGVDCAADVVDILTVKHEYALRQGVAEEIRFSIFELAELPESENSTAADDPSGKKNSAQTLCGLTHAEPRLCACQYRRHWFDGSYGYETTAWRTYRMGGYLPPHVQSDLRAPTPADFAVLGLEQAYTHALANPPPARDRWEDFPITMIIKHAPDETADKKAPTEIVESEKQTPAASTESITSVLPTVN